MMSALSHGSHPVKIRGGLVVVSGPSGSGKTTLCGRLREDSRVEISVSVTTRPPRPGEVDDKDYHFATREAFESAREKDEFAEWADVYGHLYGTLKKPLLEALDRPGRAYLLEIDVQGALQLQDQGFKGTYILVAPPSLEILRERLERRGTNDPDDIQRRLDKAAWEMSQKHRYDVVIVNDNLEAAVAEIRRYLGLQGAGSRTVPDGPSQKKRG